MFCPDYSMLPSSFCGVVVDRFNFGVRIEVFLDSDPFDKLMTNSL